MQFLLKENKQPIQQKIQGPKRGPEEIPFYFLRKFQAIIFIIYIWKIYYNKIHESNLMQAIYDIAKQEKTRGKIGV
jgi:hypothetical protein